MTVILIGMPSSGKSSAGVLLAKTLGLKFIDTDILIQEKYSSLLHQLIEKHGPDGFIELEGEVNSEVAAENAVISTGGSAVYSERAMAHFKSLGKIVYIKISYETLVERLGDYSHRGVVMREGHTLRDMFLERESLYEKWADITVESDENLSRTVEKLARRIEEEK